MRLCACISTVPLAVHTQLLFCLPSPACMLISASIYSSESHNCYIAAPMIILPGYIWNSWDKGESQNSTFNNLTDKLSLLQIFTTLRLISKYCDKKTPSLTALFPTQTRCRPDKRPLWSSYSQPSWIAISLVPYKPGVPGQSWRLVGKYGVGLETIYSVYRRVFH